jgi:hypothetical protein
LQGIRRQSTDLPVIRSIQGHCTVFIFLLRKLFSSFRRAVGFEGSSEVRSGRHRYLYITFQLPRTPRHLVCKQARQATAAINLVRTLTVKKDCSSEEFKLAAGEECGSSRCDPIGSLSPKMNSELLSSPPYVMDTVQRKFESFRFVIRRRIGSGGREIGLHSRGSTNP